MVNKNFVRINLFGFKPAFPVIVFLVLANSIVGQQEKHLLLSEALVTGINNYQSIQAKRNYLNASSAVVQNVKDQYLPNVIASVQQSYGTVNGQYGPFFATEGLGIASSGPVTKSQRWDAGFGSLYLVNANWEFFTFGRVKKGILLANSAVKKDSADLQQEEFIQSVKISGAYLTLLAAQRFTYNSEANLSRAIAVQQAVLARTRSGLIAGVDSSIANAELSRAKLSLIDARNNEQQASNQLRQLLNVVIDSFHLDTTFFTKIPMEYKTETSVEQNPQAKFYQTRIEQSDVTTAYLKKSILPGINLYGVFQTRGSGFGEEYNALNNFKYSSDFWSGITPARYNYITGISLSWNIISPIKVRDKVKAQQFVTEAYKNEYDQVTTELKNQLLLADERIENSLQAIHEVPAQYKASADAYQQKSVLYKNGLTDIVDLQLALYALNRAQTDVSVANINVWQALLIKAAASGDFELFRKQVQ